MTDPASIAPGDHIAYMCWCCWCPRTPTCGPGTSSGCCLNRLSGLAAAPFVFHRHFHRHTQCMQPDCPSACACSLSADTYTSYIDTMRHALSLATNAPPLPTNYRVGALLVDEATNTIISTGYTMKLPGNTHAEQCCLAKADRSEAATQKKIMLYTTMEPCDKRASGNTPCTETILKRGGIDVVYVGVREPEKFVGENVGRTKLEEAGIRYVHVPGLEGQIFKVATAGHVKS